MSAARLAPHPVRPHTPGGGASRSTAPAPQPATSDVHVLLGGYRCLRPENAPYTIRRGVPRHLGGRGEQRRVYPILLDRDEIHEAVRAALAVRP